MIACPRDGWELTDGDAWDRLGDGAGACPRCGDEIAGWPCIDCVEGVAHQFHGDGTPDEAWIVSAEREQTLGDEDMAL